MPVWVASPNVLRTKKQEAQSSCVPWTLGAERLGVGYFNARIKMSAHYDLLPLEPIEPAWLVKMGLVIPANYENSRNPTAAEVRLVVRQIADENLVEMRSEFRVAGDDLDAILAAGEDDTFLSVEDYAENYNQDTPRHVSFTYGSAELVLTVCERLARTCGPFLLTMDGAFFVIVNAGTHPDADWVSADF